MQSLRLRERARKSGGLKRMPPDFGSRSNGKLSDCDVQLFAGLLLKFEFGYSIGDCKGDAAVVRLR
jgi:hypothetical protein